MQTIQRVDIECLMNVLHSENATMESRASLPNLLSNKNTPPASRDLESASPKLKPCSS